MLRAERIENAMLGTSDLVRLDMDIAGHAATIFYIDAMIDKIAFELSVMARLKEISHITMPYEDDLNAAITSCMPIYVENEDEALLRLSAGDIVLMIESSDDYYVFSLKSYTMRSPSEPPTGTVRKGPREGFIEDIKVNMTMVRRRLKTRHLVFDSATCGVYSRTPIAITYIDGIADMAVVNEVKRRIDAINTDAIIDSTYVARYLEERKGCIFNQVGTVEKPDVFAAKLLVC